jgi:hypothetical protein
MAPVQGNCNTNRRYLQAHFSNFVLRYRTPIARQELSFFRTTSYNSGELPIQLAVLEASERMKIQNFD